MHLGQKLKKYVKKNYSSQSEFARIIGASPQLLYSYCQRENITWATISRIAQKIGMEAGQLIAALESIE